MINAAAIPEATSLAELSKRFDLFLVDQFGVLHDGHAAYPDAIEALARLRDSGRHVVLLSNSGKRSSPNEARLVSLGFPRSSWDLFLSSGEVAWRVFSGQDGLPLIPSGGRCLLIARDGDRTAVEGLDLRIVEAGEAADIVLLAGSEGDRFSLEHYRELLAPAARRMTPCICTNPDKVMLTQAGPRFGAGRIAELYEELGGIVTWIGKPFPDIYRVALSLMEQSDKARVIAIGDSIEHDIAGARSAGVASALVRSGILADMAASGLEALYSQHGATPDYLLPKFVWHS